MKSIGGFLLAAGALGTGLYFTLRRGGDGLSGTRGYRRRGLRGDIEQAELKLYIDNDSTLYHSQTVPIMKNLERKMAKGIYDKTKAEKLWMYLVDRGAKKYTKEFDAPDAKWHNVFSMADRRAAAKELNESFLAEHEVQGRMF